MNVPDQEYITLALGSLLKVARRHTALMEISHVIIDSLGIYDAADIAIEIQKAADTIPVDEPLS